MDEIINNIYVKNNYPALEKLYQIVKSKHPEIKRKREDIVENNIIPEDRPKRTVKKPSRYDV